MSSAPRLLLSTFVFAVLSFLLCLIHTACQVSEMAKCEIIFSCVNLLLIQCNLL